MIAYFILAVTITVALLSVGILWRATRAGLRDMWPGILLAVSLAVFIYLYGAWVFLSVYTKYVFACCFVAIAALRFLKKQKTEKVRRPVVGTAISLFFALVFCTLCILYFTGTVGKPYGAANLALPFKHGTYLVFQGGEGLPTNIFHYKLRGAVYAMDIVKLNKAGNRANAIFSSRLDDYEIFGDTIYSPCSGQVLRARDSSKDNVPPHIDRSGGSLNMLLIETDSFYVFLGHLKQGSILVKAGDRVTAGQPLGLAGNSGFTLEPHLHIQVHAKTKADEPWYRQPPLLIKFGGRSYLLFDEMIAR